MTKFVNRVLIAVVSFFPLMAALHSLEKDSPPARTSGTLLPLPPSEPQPEPAANTTDVESAWVGFPRFATALACVCPAPEAA